MPAPPSSATRAVRRARSIRRQNLVERHGDFGDAGLIALDDGGKALAHVDVAQEPHQPVEQQVLHGGVKRELQIAGNLVVASVDRGVQHDHVVAVAHGREGRRDAVRRQHRSGR